VRLASSDPSVVTAAAAACLALAELAPRLRGALAGAGALPLLVAGIAGAPPASAALCARALWALLQDDGVWRASERALRWGLTDNACHRENGSRALNLITTDC